MAIVQTLNVYQFRDAFMQSSRKDQFSYEALTAIFEYLEELSDSTGEPVELDIVGICCEWSEMTWQEVAQSYNIDLSHCTNDDERIGEVEEFLCDNSAYCLHGGDVFIFQQF